MAGRLFFGRDVLPLQEEVKILGVEVDSHIKPIAKKAFERISALRKVASFLDKKGRLLLYKAQVRPHLEYAALSWMSCAATHRKKTGQHPTPRSSTGGCCPHTSPRA